MPEAPQEVRELASARAAARANRDFALADRLRDEIADAGWTVADVPNGFSLEPSAAPEIESGENTRRRAADIVSVLDDEPMA
ncbi:MAG: hypothetical protein QOI60_1366, partial [Actinomycetota bacterium]|nr:hypothetical protein [Actinomycetota bacterium]